MVFKPVQKKLRYSDMVDMMDQGVSPFQQLNKGLHAKGVGGDAQPWKKATSGYDLSSSNFFHPTYSKALTVWLEKKMNTAKALAKETFQAEKDSIKCLQARGNSGAGSFAYLADETDTFGTAYESAIYNIENIPLAFPHVPVEETLGHAVKSDYKPPQDRAMSWAEKSADAMDEFWEGVNAELWADGDTVFTSESIESIDRIITDSTEADGSVFWSSTDDSHRWAITDTGADADATLEAQLELPATAAVREFDPSQLDDIINDCKRYSKGKNFMLVTTGQSINELAKYYGAKEFYGNNTVKVSYSVNEGIKSRTGDDVGFDVASYSGSGVAKIPIIEDEGVHAESGGIGNWYLIDRDAVKLRIALAPAWYETNLGDHMLFQRLARRFAVALGSMQLVCNNFRANGAVKYLTSS